MTSIEFKQWMEETGKTVIDVASLTKLDPNTVRSFLKGKPVHRSTKSILERYFIENQKTVSDPPSAA